jgi:hypothetical protein
VADGDGRYDAARTACAGAAATAATMPASAG